MNKRIIFIDIARSFAIALALFDHSMNDFNIWKNYAFEDYAIFKSFTTTATPTFLFLFGMMIELVYLKKYRRGQLTILLNQNLHRSLKCYLGFIFTSLAGLIGGILTLKRTIGTAIFISNNHFGNILRLYTFLILLSIPVLILRYRKGFKALFALNVAIWIFISLCQLIPVSNGNLAIFTSFFFGFGNASGPSVLLSISIVSLGMYSASFLNNARKHLFLRANLIMLVILISIVLLSGLLLPYREIFIKFITNEFRNANHPLYYIIGTSVALILISLFSLIFPMGMHASKRMTQFMVFSRKSLESFTLGNILLNLFYQEIANYEWTILAPFAFIILCWFLLVIYEKAELIPFKWNFIYLLRIRYYEYFYNNFLRQVAKLLISNLSNFSKRKSKSIHGY